MVEYNEEEVNSIEDNIKSQEVKTQAQLDLIRSYKTVFESPEGKVVLFDLMRSSSFLRPTYLTGIEAIQINEGRRSVVLDIIEVMGKKEEDILNFLTQSNEKLREYEL